MYSNMFLVYLMGHACAHMALEPHDGLCCCEKRKNIYLVGNEGKYCKYAHVSCGELPTVA